MRIAIVLSLAGFTTAAQPESPILGEGVPEFELLWEKRIDPRWTPGEKQENGITAEFVELSYDGSLLLTGNGQGEAFVFKTLDGSLVRKFIFITDDDIARMTKPNKTGGKKKRLEVECGYFSPDGKTVALGGNLNGVKVFRVSDGELLQHLNTEKAEVDGLAISPDGAYLAYAAKFSVSVVRMSDWTEVHRVPHGNTRAVTSVDVTKDGEYMVSVGGYGHVVITRTSDWQEIGDGMIPKTSSIKTVRFSPDGEYIAAGYSGAKRFAVFRFADAGLEIEKPMFYVEAVAWMPDGKHLLVGGWDGRGYMHVFRAGDWTKVGEVNVQDEKSNIEYIDIARDLVAVAGEDAKIRVFRIK